MLLGFLRRMVFGLIWFGLIASAQGEDDARRDPHSFSRPDQIRVGHLDLSLRVDFSSKVLDGTATWTLERQPGCPADAPLVLDTRDLDVAKVEAGPDPDHLAETTFSLGRADPILGSALAIQLPEGAKVVRVSYKTSPKASALQWVAPSGTADKALPFLFTQSQAIHARSWIPCQDTPAVRITYDAVVRVPPGPRDPKAPQLRAVMAAEPRSGGIVAPGNDVFRFAMTRPIPSYLVALAVGGLEFREIGERTGVWAEPSVVEKAAWEFADTEKMLEAAESLFGPYRWGRYDLLVLPPSFPYGGMENPMLTFATPTVLAGDRSQVALVAHEMAHSWSGNLVTNATWRDFWLNEGFTVYLERRIVEAVYGPDRAGMEAVLGHGELLRTVEKLPASDQILHIDLSGRDPDEGVTAIPYEKGALFLRALEDKVGRDRLTAFLRGYFDHFAFRSITTADFEAYLRSELFDDPEKPPIDLKAWLHEPGLPPGAPVPSSDRFAAIEGLANRWFAGEVAAKDLDTKGWSTLEWLHFLRSLPADLKADRLAQLDAAFRLTDTGNAEVATQWLGMAVRAGYAPADARLEAFLTSVGRRKFLMPLYEELVKTPEGKARARAIFEKARPGYHPIAVESVEKLLRGS